MGGVVPRARRDRAATHSRDATRPVALDGRRERHRRSLHARQARPARPADPEAGQANLAAVPSRR